MKSNITFSTISPTLQRPYSRNDQNGTNPPRDETLHYLPCVVFCTLKTPTCSSHSINNTTQPYSLNESALFHQTPGLDEKRTIGCQTSHGTQMPEASEHLRYQLRNPYGPEKIVQTKIYNILKNLWKNQNKLYTVEPCYKEVGHNKTLPQQGNPAGPSSKYLDVPRP